jgi:hypothetical protein
MPAAASLDARAGTVGQNEQNTKAALIEPVLRGLGWSVEDFHEVAREFRLKPREQPVNHSLFIAV